MEKTKLINIKGVDYIAKFPTVGQMMSIESFKISFTNGKYIDMSMGALNNHILALDYTDCFAYFSILIPELKKDLGILNWRDVDPFLANELVSVYKGEFLPWYIPLIKQLYKTPETDESIEKNKGGSNSVEQ